MQYFFLSLVALVLVVLGVLGFRGDKFSQAPIQVFPDMDFQDKVLSQSPTGFFDNGMGARQPVAGTVPFGGADGVLPVEFSESRAGYYYTGEIGQHYGDGLPTELKLEDEADSSALLGRGQEMYDVHCAICHGESGNGAGVAAKYLKDSGVSVANLHSFGKETSPDGYIYWVISEGKGLMGGYKHNLPVRDRWAIVAYLRALQASAK